MQTLLPTFQTSNPGLAVRESQVLHEIEVLGGVANLEMISRGLGWPKNCITGRLHDLERVGKVVGCEHKEPCPITHRKTKFWRKT